MLRQVRLYPFIIPPPHTLPATSSKAVLPCDESPRKLKPPLSITSGSSSAAANEADKAKRRREFSLQGRATCSCHSSRLPHILKAVLIVKRSISKRGSSLSGPITSPFGSTNCRPCQPTRSTQRASRPGSEWLRNSTSFCRAVLLVLICNPRLRSSF